nr:retrovirus-related Pol polyprotein from transposon TNT 1-94 [Tanacetum cinerariifolium]
YASAVHQQSDFSQPDTGLVVPVFQKGNDPYDAINHMMSFMTSIVTLRYRPTNNQLINSSNPYQQATNNNGRVTIQPIQGRQNSLTTSMSRQYTSGPSGTNSRKQRVIICCNCKGEGHMLKQCTKPKRKRDEAWFKDKVLLVQAQANRQALHEEELEFLVDPRIAETQSTDEIIPFIKALKELFNSFDQFLIDELTEVQNVFNQMEQAVEQHCVKKNKYQGKMKDVLKENERLLEQAISTDIVNIVVNANVNYACKTVNECERCVTIETELQMYFINKECYDKLSKKYTILEKHCISFEVDTQLKQEIFQRNNSFSQLSAPTFDQLFEINDLKAQSQENDTVIMKLKERIKSLSGNVKEDKIKMELEEIETINIELDHRVTKLVAENERLKQTYKQLYDSIKSSRVRSKEQCDDLKQVNIKFVENSNLNARVNLLTSASGSQPQAKKPVNRKIWQPTGKMFTTIGHKWRPTGRSFTLVGNVYPLTSITTTAIVPLRKCILIESNTSKPVVTLVYLRKSKAAKKKVPVSNSKINKSLLANKKETNNSWGSIISNVPSSTVECRLSKLFSGTVKFGNDHVAKIMGYSDYKIGNVFKGLLLGRTRARFFLCRTVKCLRSKDEAPDVIIKFLKMIQLRLKVSIRRIRTDNGTEFVNQTLCEYYEQDLLFQLMFDELFNPSPSVDPYAPEVIALIADVIPLVQAESTGLPSSTTVDQDAPSPIAHMGNDMLFGVLILEVTSAQSSSTKYDFESCDPVDTPMVEKSKLNEDKKRKAVDPSHYRVAMDEALVPHGRRLKIGRSNFYLLSDISSKESTLQLLYDVLHLAPFFKAFLVTADVLEIICRNFRR